MWKLDQSCKVTEVFPYNYGKKDGWNPMAEKTHSMCWCFTVSWSKKQTDNTHVLQIGFEREVDAIAWHDTIKGMVDRLVEAGGLNSSMLKKVNREYTPQGTPRLEQDGDEEVGTWYAIKHINGGETLALFFFSLSVEELTKFFPNLSHLAWFDGPSARVHGERGRRPEGKGGEREDDLLRDARRPSDRV